MEKKSQPKKRGRPPKKKASPSTISLVAQACGVTRTVIVRAIETGEISSDLFPTDARGQRTVPDHDAAVTAVRAHLSNPPRLGRPPKTGSTKQADLPESVDFENPDSWPTTLDGLKVVREWWIARHAKRKDDLAAGELIRAEDVKRKLFGAARTIRDQLLLIPDRTAEDMAAELDVPDVEIVRRVLREGIERGLSDLASALESSMATAPSEKTAEVESE